MKYGRMDAPEDGCPEEGNLPGEYVSPEYVSPRLRFKSIFFLVLERTCYPLNLTITIFNLPCLAAGAAPWPKGADGAAAHLRDIFHRMGCTDQVRCLGAQNFQEDV